MNIILCFLSEGTALKYNFISSSLFLMDNDPSFQSKLFTHRELNIVIPKLLAALSTWAEKFLEHLKDRGILLVNMLLGSQFWICACLR